MIRARELRAASRRVATTLHERDPAWRNPVTLRATGDGLVVEAKGHATRTAWHAIGDVRETDGFLVAGAGAQTAALVTMRAFFDATARAAFVAAIRAGAQEPSWEKRGLTEPVRGEPP